jgi:hypothetical protein
MSLVTSAFVKMVEHYGVLIGPERSSPVRPAIVFSLTLVRREDENNRHNDTRQTGT